MDGVNIAARLQEIAEPGGILVSRPVRDYARDHFRFEEVGERRLKNIPRPIRTFSAAGEQMLRLRPRRALGWRNRAIPLAAAVMAIVAVGLIALFLSRQFSSAPDHQGRPTIAVLPFANRSGDPSQE